MSYLRLAVVAASFAIGGFMATDWPDRALPQRGEQPGATNAPTPVSVPAPVPALSTPNSLRGIPIAEDGAPAMLDRSEASEPPEVGRRLDSNVVPTSFLQDEPVPASPPPSASVAFSKVELIIDGNDQPRVMTQGQTVHVGDRKKIAIAVTLDRTLADGEKIAMSIGDRLSGMWGEDGSPQIKIPDAVPTEDGTHFVHIRVVDESGNPVKNAEVFTFTLKRRTVDVTVDFVDVHALDFATPPYHIRVTFNTDELVRLVPAMFGLTPDPAEKLQTITIDDVKRYGLGRYEVIVNSAVSPGRYVFTINGGNSGVKDEYGNLLKGNDGDNFITNLVKQVGAELPSVRPGITGATGQYVTYPEFAPRREFPEGFNPHDKVESRVVRLYYFRDAHRAAQIVNRKVRSHNRAGTDMQRQLADRARSEADQQTDARQAAERNAILAAEKTREAESRLQIAQQALARAVRETMNEQRKPDGGDADTRTELEEQVNLFSARVDSARAEVMALRDKENEAREQSHVAQAAENRMREQQFRLEVAAAKADPDTYAAGAVESNDPVEQVSVSVIGEGLIHLRGPLKGINIIRTMLDQIDAPVGQVRIGVHTVQINGEREDRMEDVAAVVQRNIDQARFLTMQSAELLRRAVATVAARRAAECEGIVLAGYEPAYDPNAAPGQAIPAGVPGEQAQRDVRYLHAFFGCDFIAELAAMDSEFLHTGNKLLSLHSMDTMSLSSALNLMALANYPTRREILCEFECLVRTELPRAEESFLASGVLPERRHFLGRCHAPKLCLLAGNASFESLKAFFRTSDTLQADTLTPLQREFIRLAQIYKARLITEMEYKQRVMERSLIEERGGRPYLEQLSNARQAEEAEFTELRKVQQTLGKKRNEVTKTMLTLAAAFDQFDQAFSVVEKITPGKARVLQDGGGKYVGGVIVIDGHSIPYKNDSQISERPEDCPPQGPVQEAGVKLCRSEDAPILKKAFDDATNAIAEARRIISRFSVEDQFRDKLREADASFAAIGQLRQNKGEEAPLHFIDWRDSVEEIHGTFKEVKDYLSSQRAEIEGDAITLMRTLSESDGDVVAAYRQWSQLKSKIRKIVGAELWEELGLKGLDEQLSDLLAIHTEYATARGQAEASRRPLDHRKFLDMLIDELEEKYIELLDGTRAHTANMDSYLKRVTTALDDDFNTQFYQPVFRNIRETSVHRDVHFGQTETTTVLANNRGLAMVTPSATMEFDLPPRDLLFAEALTGARAVMDDIGALATDPTFLALAGAGINTAATAAPGSSGGFGVVRDVLPGLESETGEQVMAHQAGQQPPLGSNLQNLIPDPAIYKFETGTGFEIRPVVQPDGQAVVFDFHYMYTTEVREPVRADEKHLGRVRRHLVNTDVQLSNYELREVSRYTVALKAARTARGVPLLEDTPVVGVLFRPLPSAESSLQQNVILAQATIFPTLFDLMGLRWAPAVADLDPLRMQDDEFIVRGRRRHLENRVYDYASEQVDEFLRVPQGARRMDLYRSQQTIPNEHPAGYSGPGRDLQDSHLEEGYQPERLYPKGMFVPERSPEGVPRGVEVIPTPEGMIQPGAR